MPSLIAKFIQLQRKRESEHVNFLRSLDPSISASLADVLEGDLESIDASSWLNFRQLKWRIESAVWFLSPGGQFSPALQAKMPLIFLQAYRSEERCFVPPAEVSGGFLANCPEVLGVSAFVATDYVARLVVREIGRRVLSRLNGRLEPVLDAAMVYAMDAWKKRPPYESAWEELVHSECVDPYFFLEALRILGGMTEENLTPTQKKFRKDLLRHYSRTATAAERKALWNLPQKRSGPLARKLVERRILAQRPQAPAQQAA